MTNPTFTPGPWSWGDAGNGESILDSPDSDDPDLGYIVVYARDEVDEADAHLIAAAPELYEALNRLLGDISGEGEYRGLRPDYAYAALAKARGEP